MALLLSLHKEHVTVYILQGFHTLDTINHTVYTIFLSTKHILFLCFFHIFNTIMIVVLIFVMYLYTHLVLVGLPELIIIQWKMLF